MAQSQLAALNTQLAISVAEKDSLFSHLMSVKNSIIFVMANIDKRSEVTQKAMNQKM